MPVLFFSFLIQLTLQEYFGGDAVRTMVIAAMLFGAVWIIVVEARNGLDCIGSLNSVFDFFVFYILTFQTMVVGIVNANMRPALYVLLACSAYLSVRIYVYRYGVVSFSVCLFLATFFSGLFAVIFDYSGLVNALSIDKDLDMLARFAPFGMHPNLSGHVYSAAAGVGVCVGLTRSSIKSMATFILLSLLMLIIPVASSSRGSMLGFCVGMTFVLYVLYSRKLLGINYYIDARLREIITISVLLLIILIFMNFDDVARILEFDSEYRGLDSGFTGRDYNWKTIVSMSMETFFGSVMGHGMRTWDGSAINVDTDSSYVNTLWELGLPSTIMVFGLYIYCLAMLIKRAFHVEHLCAIFIISFLLFEGIFARYAFAIGNPASLFGVAVIGFYLGGGRNFPKKL